MDEKKNFEDESSVLRSYLKEIAKIPLLSPDEERRLAQDARAGDEEALSRLVEANLRFVVKFAKRYRNCGLSLLDLVNEGILTLTQAAKRLPKLRQGRPVHVATLWRWAHHGLRGIKLETMKMGGTRVTSLEALQRFFQKLSDPDERTRMPMDQKRMEKVEAELKRLGF